METVRPIHQDNHTDCTMSSLQRPSKQCTSSGCRTPAVPGTSSCEHHHQQRLERLHQSQPKSIRTQKYGGSWQRTRKRILNRDNHQCVYCYDTGTTHPLEVHHTTNNPNAPDHELVTLCYRHHRAVEAETKRGIEGKVGRRIREWLAR